MLVDKVAPGTRGQSAREEQMVKSKGPQKLGEGHTEILKGILRGTGNTGSCTG